MGFNATTTLKALQRRSYIRRRRLWRRCWDEVILGDEDFENVAEIRLWLMNVRVKSEI